MEDVGPAVVAGCETPPSLCREKSEHLDFVTPTVQPLAVMDCCNGLVSYGSDGAGCKRDALLGQHLADFVPVIPLIFNHRGRRGQSLSTLSAPVQSLHCPSYKVEPQGTTFAVADPMELAGLPPSPGATDQAGGTPPFVEAGRRGMGFDVSGVHHQDLGFWGIRWLCGIGCWQLGKDQIKNTLVSPAAAAVVEGFVGTIGGPGHPPSAAPSA